MPAGVPRRRTKNLAEREIAEWNRQRTETQRQLAEKYRLENQIKRGEYLNRAELEKALLGAVAELKSFYKLTYLAAAGEAGLLNRLASGPATLDSLAEFCAAGGRGREALEAWLQIGVRLRLLSLGPRGYALRALARKLARPENDPVLAMVEEVVELHHKLITATIPKLRAGELWSLTDQSGELIARSSRVLETFQAEIIRSTFPARGALPLLEIGCGSGVYLRYAAERNPSLTALGVELQLAVAEMARTNLRSWGLESRVKVETGDIREI